MIGGRKKNSFSSNKLKITTISLFALVVVFSLGIIPALAVQTGLEYGTYTGLSTQDIRITIMKVVRIFLGLVGIIALIIILYGGFIWMTSAGNAEKIEQAKRILRNAIIGLVIIFSAFSIVSFIINVLEGALIPGGPPGGGGPPYGCENCGHLGSGIIESVYPAPLSREVPRDTIIIVTFKEKINPESIMDVAQGTVCSEGATNPCANKNLAVSGGKPNIRIYKQAEGDDTTLEANQVIAASEDMKTYIFTPVAPLGDSANRYWYAVKLTNDISRDSNNESAFPGAGNYFAWSFEVGTKLDLIPPQTSNVFPVPDNEVDDYSVVAGAQAQGTITLTKQPNINQEAAATLITQCNDTQDNNGDGQVDLADSSCGQENDITPEGDPNDSIISFDGSYNGPYQGTLTLTVDGNFANLNASWNPANPNGADSYPIESATQRVEIGSGLSVTFQETAGTNARGKSFSIQLIPQSSADTLQIAATIYRFVNSLTPGETEINVTASSGSSINLNTLAQNIASKIDSQTQNPDMQALASGAVVTLKAQLAGRAGNFINVASTGNWAAIQYPTIQGRDETLTASPRDKADQPRNAIIKVDFNEGVLPTEVAGVVEVNDLNADGVGAVPSFSNITVQVDLNDNGVFEEDEYVAGSFSQSNQYKTVEFISLRPCQDSSGNEIKNSCGEPVYCLPVNPSNDYIKYQVTIKAGKLRTCSDDNQCAGLRYESGLLTEECKDITPSYPGPVCASEGGVFYLKAASPPEGVVDLSSNSFDGNKDTYTQGPQSQSSAEPYSLNSPAISDGDDLVWTFFIKNKVDLQPPTILDISPKVGGVGSSVASPIGATFNKILQSSSVKPGGGYFDGKCSCNNKPDCPNDDQDCINNLCINQNDNQLYCGNDNQCGRNQTCQTKKYVSLYDNSVRPVAWWVSNRGEDIRMCLSDAYLYRQCSSDSDCGGGTCGLQDGYADRSLVQINHTAFFESTQYSAEMASGIQDIYQNCFMPGKGPTDEICDPWPGGSGCCPVGLANPYCCNGIPSNQSCSQ